jgi:hypothetical protein
MPAQLQKTGKSLIRKRHSGYEDEVLLRENILTG